MAITPPTKFAAIWANDEGSSFVTQPIPTASQPGVRASLNDGFPQLTFTSPNAPDGRDFNGILYMLTAAAQFQQAGGIYAWDSTFEGNIGGYPLGAVVANASVTGFFWINTVANNTTNPDAGGAGWTGFQIANQPSTGAQLVFTSATVLTLAPKAGGWLWINGFNYQVPSSNPTTTNSGLAANTLYYVYAAISAGNMVLDAPSTTGYTVGTNAIASKSGDPTRTLVGMVQTQLSTNQFISQDGFLQVRSYWQRPRTVRSRTSFAANHTTTSGTFVEVSNTIRNSFLVWAGENVDWSISGGFNSSTSGTNAFTGVGFDGTTPELEQAVVGGPAGNVAIGSVGLRGIKTGLSEGLHYATLLGASGGGAAQWFGGSSTPGAYDVIDIVLNG